MAEKAPPMDAIRMNKVEVMSCDMVMQHLAECSDNANEVLKMSLAALKRMEAINAKIKT